MLAHTHQHHTDAPAAAGSITTDRNHPASPAQLTRPATLHFPYPSLTHPLPVYTFLAAVTQGLIAFPAGNPAMKASTAAVTASKYHGGVTAAATTPACSPVLADAQYDLGR